MKQFYSQYKSLTSSFLPKLEEDTISVIHSLFTSCPSCSKKFKVKSTGVLSPYLMIITDAPSQYDEETGVLCSDKIGTKVFGLIEYLNRHKRIVGNFYLTGLSWCSCKVQDLERLKQETTIVNPKKILILGDQLADKILNSSTHLITHSVLFHKYIPCYVTYSLGEIFYLNGEVKLKVKADLDYLIND